MIEVSEKARELCWEYMKKEGDKKDLEYKSSPTYTSHSTTCYDPYSFPSGYHIELPENVDRILLQSGENAARSYLELIFEQGYIG